MINNESDFHQYPAILKKELLNATLSEFFKSPSFELKGILGKLFQFLFSSETEIHLKDLASLYYIAMQTNISQFKQSFMLRR